MGQITCKACSEWGKNLLDNPVDVPIFFWVKLRDVLFAVKLLCVAGET